MNLQYRIGLFDGSGPFASEVLESDGSGARIRDISTGNIYHLRRVDILFPTFAEAKEALLDFNLLQIQYAEDKIRQARQRLRELIALQEPNHDA